MASDTTDMLMTPSYWVLQLPPSTFTTLAPNCCLHPAQNSGVNLGGRERLLPVLDNIYPVCGLNTVTHFGQKLM